MNNLIKIGNQEITTKEFKGKRVVTFKDIDLVHERPEGTAGRNFRDNKERFIDGTDYFFVKPQDIQTDEIRRSEINNSGTYLITEQGYLMLVKSFTDDLAWTVQRQLVNTYFKKMNLIDGLSTEMKALIMHDKKIQAVVEHISKTDDRLDKLEFDIPLYGCEAKELSDHVKRKGVQTLGGKKSNAYSDNAIRSSVYRDIYDQIKREFGLYDAEGKNKTYLALKRKYLADAHECVDCYEAPLYLQERIDDANRQMKIDDIA